MNLFPQKPKEVEPTNMEVQTAEQSAAAQFNAVAHVKDKERNEITAEIELLTGEKFSVASFWKSIDGLIKIHVQTGLDIGIRLLAIKANTEHGEFTAELEKRKIEIRTAENYMRIAHDFHKLDPEFRSQIGISKLYALLQAAPEDREMLVEKGRTSFIDKDELLTISARELKKLIQDEKQKLTEDIEVSEARRDALHKEKVHLEKEVERLKSKGDQSSPNPVWWDHMFKILADIAKWEQIIRENPPDLENEDIAKAAQFSLDRLNDSMARCTRFMTPVAFDTAHGRLVDQDRIDDVKKRHSDWDFDQLDATSDI